MLSPLAAAVLASAAIGQQFGPAQRISTQVAQSLSIFTADLDGDGDPDVLSAAELDDKVAWYENTDGAGIFGSKVLVTKALAGVSCIEAVDKDSDGDLDLLASAWNNDEIAWIENTDGQGTFDPAQLFDTGTGHGTRTTRAADLDGDGDQDVIAALHSLAVWSENVDGLGGLGPQQPITSSSLVASSAWAADVDGDGDLDVFTGEVGAGGSGALAWYENADGSGAFGPQQPILQVAYGIDRAVAEDLDGDGDPDALMAALFSGEIAWFENLQGPLMTDAQELSLTSGGSQHLYLAAGASNQLRPYLLPGSLSGTLPGTALDGHTLPLNPDAYFLFTLAAPSSATHQDTLGVLDAKGNATARLVLSPGTNSSLAGVKLHHAFVVLDLSSIPGAAVVGFASNAAPLGLVP